MCVIKSWLCAVQNDDRRVKRGDSNEPRQDGTSSFFMLCLSRKTGGGRCGSVAHWDESVAVGLIETVECMGVDVGVTRDSGCWCVCVPTFVVWSVHTVLMGTHGALHCSVAVAHSRGGGVRYVAWSQDGKNVALISKTGVVLADKNAAHLHSLFETSRIKGGAWDENGVFVYATMSHVKYCLTNGDGGIIQSLKEPIYITQVMDVRRSDGTCFCGCACGESCVCVCLISSTLAVHCLSVVHEKGRALFNAGVAREDGATSVVYFNECAKGREEMHRVDTLRNTGVLQRSNMLQERATLTCA